MIIKGFKKDLEFALFHDVAEEMGEKYWNMNVPTSLNSKINLYEDIIVAIKV